jgi:hypothetical protein
MTPELMRDLVILGIAWAIPVGFAIYAVLWLCHRAWRAVERWLTRLADEVSDWGPW